MKCNHGTEEYVTKTIILEMKKKKKKYCLLKSTANDRILLMLSLNTFQTHEWISD